MAEILGMPKFGLTMTEGNVLNWMKQEGDEVKKGEPLFEVETDKITNEVEAPIDGYIRHIFIQEGYEIPCGEPIAIIGDKDEDITSLKGNDVKPSENQEENITIEQSPITTKNEAELDFSIEGYVLATPQAKKLALEQNINLSLLKGTGPRGIVTTRDVKIENRVSSSPMAKKWAQDHNIDLNEIQQDKRILLPDVIAASMAKNNQTHADDASESNIQPLSRMRKVIASRMSSSWREIPHVTLNKEIDVTSALTAMKQLREIGLEEGNVKLTFTHLLIKIVGAILPKFPHINAWFNGEEITIHRNVHIGVATSLDSGLVVPVLRDVNKKDLYRIIKDLNQLTESVKGPKSNPSQLQGSTFTISNLGMFGIDTFTPIINQPETAILGVGRMVEKPVFVGEDIQKRTFIPFSLSFDHRVMDGTPAAQFLNELDKYLQQPLRLLLGGEKND